MIWLDKWNAKHLWIHILYFMVSGTYRNKFYIDLIVCFFIPISMTLSILLDEVGHWKDSGRIFGQLGLPEIEYWPRLTSISISRRSSNNMMSNMTDD